MRNGREKGARGEREVVKLLTPWWRQIEPTAEFIRTPRSGGLPNAEAFQASGDVMVDRRLVKRFPFCVEVKFSEKWNMRGILDPRLTRVPTFWRWWQQACTEADDDGLSPLLFFRKAREVWRCLGLPAMFHGHVRGSVLVEVPELYRRVRNRGGRDPAKRSRGGRFAAMFGAEELLVTDPEIFAREPE